MSTKNIWLNLRRSIPLTVTGETTAHQIV